MPVPADAYRVSEDIVISDNLVAVTRAGTVIDTKVDGTQVSLADGTRVTVGTDGTVTLDPNFRNPGQVVDASTMRGDGTYISGDGTQVQIVDGKVVITDPSGERLTVFANGSCKIDVPDPGTTPPGGPPPVPTPVPEPTPEPHEPGGGTPGGGSPGGGSPGGGSPGGEPPGGGYPGGGTPGGGTPGGGTPGGGTPGGGTPGGEPGGGYPGGPPGGGTPGGGTSGGGTPGGGTPGGGTPGGGTPGGGTPGGGYQPWVPPKPPQGHDIKVTPGDLLKDAQYFTVQSTNADTLAKCFTDVAGLIKEYGLWFAAESPYRKACGDFATLYQGAGAQMTEIGGALTKAAKSYRSNEDKGEELAEGMF